MKKYILAIDQGTTSSRAILFDKQGSLCFSAQKEISCLFPQLGWVEENALEIYLSVMDVIMEVLVKANLTMDNVDSIGITNQRETTIVWEKSTGMPIYNAIVWQSRQTADICDNFIDKKDFIHEKTGLLINPYFSASKIRFILDHVENGQERAEKGELMAGTVDAWLIYKLTNGKTFATDVSNASRTMLFNINTLSWDDELCALFNIPKIMLPEVKDSSDNYGVAHSFKCNVPITGVAGDQQAALFGQTCFKSGESKNTYGTGCFMLMNTGNKPVFSKKGLLTTVAWKIQDNLYYALEGSVFMGGATVQWLRDQMKLIENAPQSEELANKEKDSGGVYLVPAFVGLGTPYWDDDARGSVFGLTRSTTKNQFVMAALEGIAYQCKDVFETMKEETNCSLNTLWVDGGATANNYLMQFQSDILNCEIKLPQVLETTALGAAYLAGLYTGYYESIYEVKKIHAEKKNFTPFMTEKEREKKYNGWKKAIEATRLFK